MIENHSELEPLLSDLGFSPIETGIYIFLLQESPATGYRISHGIGKPTANTYKAITALHEKGALLIDEGDKKLVRAVPPKELLARLKKSYAEDCDKAEALLSAVTTPVPDDRVWQLTAVAQVYERARSMIESAEEVVLADLFPAQMDELKGDLEKAAKRGIKVCAIVYEETTAKGIDLAMRPGELTKIAWPGNQLNLVTDATQHLLCMFTKDNLTVHQAIWSNSTFLSCLQYNALCVEFLLKSLLDKDQEELVYAHPAAGLMLTTAQPPGLRQLIASLGESDTLNWGTAS